MKKILVIGIVLMFLCVTLSSTVNFNTVKASLKNEYVNVSIVACGIKGYKETIIRLTQQQYKGLEQYLVEFRARLNQTVSSSDANLLFKKAVEEISKYGLIPQGMSIKQAQQLISYSPSMKILTGGLSGEYRRSLIVGKLTHLIYFSPSLLLLEIAILFIEFIISIVTGYNGYAPPLQRLLNWIEDYSYSDKFQEKHFAFRNVLQGNPSSGWISTFGIYGKKNWNGTLNVSSLGFTGFKILDSTGNWTLLGKVADIKVSE